MEDPWPAVAAAILAVVAFAAMLAATITWMTAPAQILHWESSPAKTDVYSIEVADHGRPRFLTPDQDARLKRIRRVVPIVWFSGFGYLVLFMGLGGLDAILRDRS